MRHPLKRLFPLDPKVCMCHLWHFTIQRCLVLFIPKAIAWTRLYICAPLLGLVRGESCWVLGWVFFATNAQDYGFAFDCWSASHVSCVLVPPCKMKNKVFWSTWNFPSSIYKGIWDQPVGDGVEEIPSENTGKLLTQLIWKIPLTPLSKPRNKSKALDSVERGGPMLMCWQFRATLLQLLYVWEGTTNTLAAAVCAHIL